MPNSPRLSRLIASLLVAILALLAVNSAVGYLLIATNLEKTHEDLLSSQIAPYIEPILSVSSAPTDAEREEARRALFEVWRVYKSSGAPFSAESLRPVLHVIIQNDEFMVQDAQVILGGVLDSGTRRLDGQLGLMIELLLARGLWDSRAIIRHSSVTALNTVVRSGEPSIRDPVFARIKAMSESDPSDEVRGLARIVVTGVNPAQQLLNKMLNN